MCIQTLFLQNYLIYNSTFRFIMQICKLLIHDLQNILQSPWQWCHYGKETSVFISYFCLLMYFEIITDKDVFIVLSKLILMNRYIFHKVKVLISSYFATFSLEEFAIPSKNHCLSFCAINGMYISLLIQSYTKQLNVFSTTSWGVPCHKLDFKTVCYHFLVLYFASWQEITGS